MTPATGHAPRVAVVTLGCGRNEVDSDQVAGTLTAAGFELSDDPEQADCVLVNTCTFIGPAREESIDTILAACDLQAPGGGQMPVLVIGCMAERYGQELAEAVPEAAGVLGFDHYRQLPEIVRGVVAGRAPGSAHRPPASSGRQTLPLVHVRPGDPPTAPSGPPTAAFPVRTVPRGPWAYMKIAGGCDRRCTFCTIPSYRGRFRSRPLDELVAEAGWLCSNGVRELVCVSENTTSWGKDLSGGRSSQADLVRGFESVEGLERVRLMYLQPAEVTGTLLDAMAASRVVAPYYDLSLQHASGPVLRRMARRGDAEQFLELVASIRARDPLATFRSSFIVGFPGETEADVEVLERFLLEAGLDWTGFFTFSPEDGTPAAAMPDQVDPAEAAARRDRLVEVAESVAEDRALEWVGRRVDVLVEAHEDGAAVGRCEREAPDTDGEVRVLGHGTAGMIGRMMPVRLTAADGVDLLGEPATPGRAG